MKKLLGEHCSKASEIRIDTVREGYCCLIINEPVEEFGLDFCSDLISIPHLLRGYYARQRAEIHVAG
jgi:hypothetical protein